MIKLTRNAFVCALFSFMCISAVYGENKQQVLNENRLKALISEVALQVPTFKAEYDNYMQMEIVQEEKAIFRKDLISIVEKTKKTLEQELTALGDNNVKKSILAKGLAQTAGGLYGLASVALCYWIDYLRVTTRLTPEETKNDIEQDKKTRINKIKAICHPYRLFGPVYELMNLIAQAGKNVVRAQVSSSAITGRITWWDIAPCIPGGFPFLFLATTTGISGFQIKYGLENMKKGVDYKAHLNQRIKNLDEVSTYIQAQDVLK
ncbi:hypothetical protein H0X06_00740 [Candidatus Dependentiae bacterium]|nr:hypothetical protein [Candidatus Dependentiae bacterium]